MLMYHTKPYALYHCLSKPDFIHTSIKVSEREQDQIYQGFPTSQELE